MEKSFKNYFIENLSKRLLQLKFESNRSIKSKALKYALKKISESLQNIQTYCLSCENDTNNMVWRSINDK